MTDQTPVPVPDDVKAAIADGVDELVGKAPDELVEEQRQPSSAAGGEDEAVQRAFETRFGGP